MVGGATFQQDAEGRNGDAEPAQDRARTWARSRSSRARRSRATLSCAMAVGRDGRGPARRRRSAPDTQRPRASRATRTSCSTIRRARSAARRSRCSTASSTREGQAQIEKDLDLPRDVPGMLNATFITRVFERGGAFSINRETRTVAAFDRYVGLQAAQGRRGARHAAHGHQAHGGAGHAGPRRQAGVRAAPAGHALQGAVALVVGPERRLAGAVRAEREHGP